MLRSAGGACRALLGASGSLDIASTSVNGRVVAYAAMQQLVHSMLNRKWLLQQSHGPQRAASSTTSSAAAQPQAGVSPAPENAAMAPPNITLHDSAVKVSRCRRLGSSDLVARPCTGMRTSTLKRRLCSRPSCVHHPLPRPCAVLPVHAAASARAAGRVSGQGCHVACRGGGRRLQRLPV